LTLRGAMKLLSPPRQSDPHVEETTEGSAGTVAASAVEPMAIKDKRKLLGTKRRRRALNVDGSSIPSTGSQSLEPENARKHLYRPSAGNAKPLPK